MSPSQPSERASEDIRNALAILTAVEMLGLPRFGVGRRALGSEQGPKPVLLARDEYDAVVARLRAALTKLRGWGWC